MPFAIKTLQKVHIKTLFEHFITQFSLLTGSAPKDSTLSLQCQDPWIISFLKGLDWACLLPSLVFMHLHWKTKNNAVDPLSIDSSFLGSSYPTKIGYSTWPIFADPALQRAFQRKPRMHCLDEIKEAFEKYASEAYNGRGLKTEKISFQVLSNLTAKSLERQLADKTLGALLVPTDLTESKGFQACTCVAFWLFLLQEPTSSGQPWLPTVCVGPPALPPPTSRFASGLLCTRSH